MSTRANLTGVNFVRINGLTPNAWLFSTALHLRRDSLSRGFPQWLLIESLLNCCEWIDWHIPNGPLRS